ncbi:MAG: transcriptional regulator [Flavobacteriales bacterium]|nr:transcriptional regulator [Flavobacteriales bacterium]
MVDVVSQYERYSSQINKKVLDVIKSGCYIKGSEVEKFEKSLSTYLNSKHVISCANGTDALSIALMSLNLNAGDEVLVPTFTFVSTVEAVCLLGLKPVFLDINPKTFLLDHKMVETKISHKTKAIIPVHLFGQCCDMQSIISIAKKFQLFIIEDAAQSLGSKCLYNSTLNKKFSGTLGHIGITSFYPSNNLGCFGDGGALFTQNKELADKIYLLANHGQKERYIYDTIGLNSRLDALQAAVLSFKLPLLDSFNKLRQKIAQQYNTRLKSLSWLTVPITINSSDHIYHQYSIILDSQINRLDFQNYLSENGIPTMIYYPKPLHKQRPYMHFVTNQLPIAEMICENIISLPIHPEMENDQVQFICDKIQKYNN